MKKRGGALSDRQGQHAVWHVRTAPRACKAPNREERDRPGSAKNRCAEATRGAWAHPLTLLARGGHIGRPHRPDRSWPRWGSLESSTAQTKSTMTPGAAVAGVSSAFYLEVSRVRASVLPEAFFASSDRRKCRFSPTRFSTSSKKCVSRSAASCQRRTGAFSMGSGV